MAEIVNVQYVLNSIIFSFIGMGVLALGFVVIDKLTPYTLWREIIEEHNVALAIVVASMTLGISIIIASSIHG